MGGNLLFEAQNLSFAYGQNQVLQGLEFAVRRGTVTAFMGANGCGKTTLFRLMTKQLKPQTGKVLLDGEEIAAIRLRDFARRVAVLHQSNTAPPDWTVRRLVGYGRAPHRCFGQAGGERDAAAVARALELTGLAALAQKPVGELSGGQRQRAFFAMALAQEPQILFLDEPTTYLDIRCQIELLRFIRRLNEESGMTILMVLHDVNQALRCSDEILALSPRGALLAQGAPEDAVTPGLLKEMYGIPLELARHGGKPFVPVM